MTEATHLAESVAGLSVEALEQELALVLMKNYQYIQDHIAYKSTYLSEIITISHMQGLWLEKT